MACPPTSSRTPSVSQRDTPASEFATARPRFFVDRSMGRIEFPRLLRAAGVELVTLAEHYGIPADERVEDVTWLADTSRLDWPVIAKDERIRRRPAERRAVRDH